MGQADMLDALKIDLGVTSNAYDGRLSQLLQAAAEEIIREGAASLNAASSVSDAGLVIMYAGWLWRKRDSMEGMPRMLRYQLNNRVFSEKIRG